MSQENAEVVRRNVEAWNRRDLKAWLATFRSDAEIDWSRARGPFMGVYRGHRELEVFWNEFWSTFEDVQVEMHGFTEAGSEVVVELPEEFEVILRLPAIGQIAGGAAVGGDVEVDAVAFIARVDGKAWRVGHAGGR